MTYPTIKRNGQEITLTKAEVIEILNVFFARTKPENVYLRFLNRYRSKINGFMGDSAYNWFAHFGDEDEWRRYLPKKSPIEKLYQLDPVIREVDALNYVYTGLLGMPSKDGKLDNLSVVGSRLLNLGGLTADREKQLDNALRDLPDNIES